MLETMGFISRRQILAQNIFCVQNKTNMQIFSDTAQSLPQLNELLKLLPVVFIKQRRQNLFRQNFLQSEKPIILQH